MSNEAAPTPEAAAAKPAPQLNIKAQLTRNLSFKNPGALRKFDQTPTIAVNINVDAAKAQDSANEFMVGLKIQATATSGEEQVYALALDYAGLFSIANVDAKMLEPVLLVECPRLLFPFARRIIADVTRDGGYQPMMLDPVDFVALYRRELERRQQAQKPDSDVKVN